MAGPNTLGRSLKLVDGDLVMVDRVIAGEGGARTVRTLDETSGVANLAQALTLRVLTPAGADMFNTTYGFDAADVFTHGATAGTVRDLIQLNVVRALGTDPRVREIREVDFVEPSPRSRRSWRVAVTVVTVDGAQQSFTIAVGT
jgi:hypothetical protein